MRLDFERDLDSLLRETVLSAQERERTTLDRELSASGSRVVLFGAGNLGGKAQRCLRQIGVEPLAFADNNPSRWGTKIADTRVLSPQAAAEEFGDSALFMVTIWSLNHTFRETHTKLKALGCRRVISSSSLRWRFASELLPDFCQDLPHKVLFEAAQIREVAALWADDQSRTEFLAQLRWRVLGDMGTMSIRDTEESYFLDELYGIERGEVFVDCGAYTGDTASAVLMRNPDFGSILAIEADPTNYQRLCDWIAGLEPSVAERISSYPVAIGSARSKLRFKTGEGEGSRLAAEGDIEVDCLPLDDLAAGTAVSFIKMDIEGAEFDALAGSKRTIQEHQPILAICVYHLQADLWRIPHLIDSFGCAYSYFLRHHEGDGWQTVCYAVPLRRLRPGVITARSGGRGKT